MINWIKTEVTNVLLRLKLNKIIAKYNETLLKYSKLRELASVLGEMGQDIKKDTEIAERQCRDCIRRYNNLNESLKDKDYRYIKQQYSFALNQAKIFEESALKVQRDALDLELYIKQGALNE